MHRTAREDPCSATPSPPAPRLGAFGIKPVRMRPAKNVESYRPCGGVSKNASKNNGETAAARAGVDVGLPQGAARTPRLAVRDGGAGRRRDAARKRSARRDGVAARRGEGAERRRALRTRAR